MGSGEEHLQKEHPEQEHPEQEHLEEDVGGIRDDSEHDDSEHVGSEHDDSEHGASEHGASEYDIENEPSSLGVAGINWSLHHPTFIRLATTADLDAAANQVRRDMALMFASGRWRPGRDDPDPLTAGDLPIIRGIISGAHLHELSMVLSGQHPLGADDGIALALTAEIAAYATAVPHFIDGDTTLGLLSSTPPDEATVESLRLPFPAVYVGYGRELDLGDNVVWPKSFRKRPIYEVNPTGGFHTTLEHALMDRGGKLTGIILFSGPDGKGLDDLVCWVVSANPDPNHPMEVMRRDRQRSLVLANRNTALWGHIISNTAAAVAWMDWTTPEPLELPDPDDRMWRKAVRTSRYRKQEPKGAAGGVHVIARKQSSAPPRAGRDDDTAKRASPIPHIRTGHWRSVRIAERDVRGNVVGAVSGVEGVDWHYEGRWVPPTVVAAGNEGELRDVVYVVPPAPHDTSTP